MGYAYNQLRINHPLGERSWLQLQLRFREQIASQSQSLVIEFIENCCFCCDPMQVDFFFPQLPLGDHVAGMVWSGAARQSGTIKFGHKAYGGECGASDVPMDGGRSIIVGT